MNLWRRVWRLAFVVIGGIVGISHSQDVPYYPRDTKANQDLGGINQNYHELAKPPGGRLTQTVGPDSCPASQSLTGAAYKNGQTWGGTCTATAVLSANQTFTGANTFSGAATFTGAVSISTWSVKQLTSGSSSGTAFSTCVGTVTITIVGSTVTVWGSGSAQADSSLNGWVNLLVDGAYVLSQTRTKGMVAEGTAAAAPMNLSFPNTAITGLSVGQHNFCIGLGVTSGSSSFPATNSGSYQLGVREETLR